MGECLRRGSPGWPGHMAGAQTVAQRPLGLMPPPPFAHIWHSIQGPPCGPSTVLAASQPVPALDQTVPWTGSSRPCHVAIRESFGEPSPRHGKNTAHPDSGSIEKWPRRSRCSTALHVQARSRQLIRPSDRLRNRRELRIRSAIEMVAASIPVPPGAGTDRPNPADATRQQPPSGVDAPFATNNTVHTPVMHAHAPPGRLTQARGLSVS